MCLVTFRVDEPGEEQQCVAVAPFLESFFLLRLGTYGARPKFALPATHPAPASLGSAGRTSVNLLGRASALGQHCCLPGKSLRLVSSLPWLFSASHLLASHLPSLSRVLAFKYIFDFVMAC